MARAQSTPDAWCEKCAEAKAAREAKREAKKKAKSARKKEKKEKKPTTTPEPVKVKRPSKAKAKPEDDEDAELEGVVQGAHVHHDGKKATLKAATFASRNGLHWTDLDGTGKGGTVTMGDVEKAVQDLTTA